MEKGLFGISKRMDKTLPFYYFTSYQSFYVGEIPSFNESRSKPKWDRAPRCELLAGSVCRRASFPIRSNLSIRTQFHNVPVNLPPPPTATIHQKLMAAYMLEAVFVCIWLTFIISKHYLCMYIYNRKTIYLNEKRRCRDG